MLAAANQIEFVYVWSEARPEGKAIIIVLVLFSIFAWSVMASKAIQIRRARKLNAAFDQAFREQENLTELYHRKIPVDGCPLFSIYEMGNHELAICQKRHESKGGPAKMISLKSMEHVKRALERGVAQEALRPAGRHSLHVWLQLAGAQHAGIERRDGQLCSGIGVQNRNRLHSRR